MDTSHFRPGGLEDLKAAIKELTDLVDANVGLAGLESHPDSGGLIVGADERQRGDRRLDHAPKPFDFPDQIRGISALLGTSQGRGQCCGPAGGGL
jgi:hypothetical protein